MTAEQYKPIYHWFSAHPAVKRLVVFLDRWLPLVPFVCYPVLLCLLNIRLSRLFLTQKQAALDFMVLIARSVFVPGLVFWGGTLLRSRLHFPRPYEQPGFTPLVAKESRGHSMPSPPRAERRRAGGGVAVFLPRCRLRDGGRCPAHLLPAGAHRGASCAGRGVRLCTGLCAGRRRNVAAVRPFLHAGTVIFARSAKKLKLFSDFP